MDEEVTLELKKFAETLVRVSMELENRVNDMEKDEAIAVLREINVLVTDVEGLASEMELFMRKEGYARP